jgi:excisionase family DNA binding protein
VAEAAQEARTTDAWRTDVDAEVYTVQQAAGWLKVSPSKGYEMCRRGELKHGRFGNAIRIHRRSLLAALGNREVEKR